MIDGRRSLELSGKSSSGLATGMITPTADRFPRLSEWTSFQNVRQTSQNSISLKETKP